MAFSFFWGWPYFQGRTVQGRGMIVVDTPLKLKNSEFAPESHDAGRRSGWVWWKMPT